MTEESVGRAEPECQPWKLVQEPPRASTAEASGDEEYEEAPEMADPATAFAVDPVLALRAQLQDHSARTDRRLEEVLRAPCHLPARV